MPTGNPGVPKSPEHNRKVSEALRGRKLSASHRENLRKSKTETHKEALRNAQTPEVIAKRRATNIQRRGYPAHYAKPENNRNNVLHWTSRGYSEEDAKTKVSEIQKNNASKVRRRRTAWKVDFWLEQGCDLEEAKRKVSALQVVNASKSKRTVSKAGTEFIDNVEKLVGFKFSREVVVEKRFKVDGFNAEHKVVLEFFGTFWHMHPSIFSPEDVNRVTGWKAQSKWNEDQGRIKYLTAAGYKVFVVWEHEASVEKVEQIAKEIKDACCCC